MKQYFNRRQKLLQGMKAFAYTANVPVTLYDNNLCILWECHPELKLCTMFMSHNIRNNQCDANLQRAIAEAKGMKEPYVFMCASGLTGIAYSIEEEGAQKETLIVGPIIMGKNRESALRHMFKYLPDFRDYANELFSLIEKNRIRTSMEVSCLYEVFCDCVFSYKLLENNPVSDDTFMDKLLHPLQVGDIENALANLELIFERAYIANGGNINHIKGYLSERFEDLSKHLLSQVFSTERYKRLVSQLKDAITTEEIHSTCKKIVMVIVDYKYKVIEYEGQSHVIREAIQYLKENYRKDIELKELSDAVHVNASYLSALFKKETSMTFSQHLNVIRLAESIRLLKTSDLTLEEIAQCCGFASQSYFIRTFRQYYNETPGKFRRAFLKKE